MERPPTLREFTEDRFGGPIAFYTFVNQAREAGSSWRAIARTLDRDHHIRVSDVTLAVWFTPQQKGDQ